MARFVPQLLRTRRHALAAPEVPAHARDALDLDAVITQLRDVWVRVPCAGCGGAHEMTCAELLTRQIIRGAGWPSEECDDGALLSAILSPEEAAACGGDVSAICAALEHRGFLCAPAPSPPGAAGAFTPGHEPNHILLAH
jgi:hypothetical protein